MPVSNYNLINGIPPWKILEVRDNKGSITNNHPLIMKDGLSIKVESKYGQLYEAQPSSALSLLSQEIGLPSGQFALQGAQVWQSTEPIRFNINATLEMDTDPYDDVIVPTFTLMKAVTPAVADKTDEKGWGEELIDSLANSLGAEAKMLIPPGPNLTDLLHIMSNDESVRNKVISQRGKIKGRGFYNIKVGYMMINYCILTSVEPSFSTEVAESITKKKKLYPVSADLSIEFTTAEVATINMLNDICQS